jgi:hypothetical protein
MGSQIVVNACLLWSLGYGGVAGHTDVSHCKHRSKMAAARFPFTDRTLAILPFVSKGQMVVRDSDLAGFFVRIGIGTKTYMVQGDLWKGGRRQSLSIKGR